MINLKSALNFLGYGRVSLGILKSLILDHQQEISYFPIGQPECESEYHYLIQQSITNQEKLDPFASCLTIWHENAIHERIGKGLSCALSFFETDFFPERTKRSIQCQDKFIIASQWAADIVQKEIPTQECYVVRMGVDSNYFKPNLSKINKPYRFLNIGKTEVRKGHDILHDLFNKAFTQQDDVELYISWDNPFLSPEDKQKWVDMYKSTPLGNKIHFVPRQLDIRNEYAKADCCIFPSRAEAICLPALEAISCEKPIICCNYSGFTSFATKENAFLIDIDELEPAFDGIWFDGSGNWARIGSKQEDQIIEYMRYCYKNRINTNHAGRITAEELDWKHVTKELMEILK